MKFYEVGMMYSYQNHLVSPNGHLDKSEATEANGRYIQQRDSLPEHIMNEAADQKMNWIRDKIKSS